MAKASLVSTGTHANGGQESLCPPHPGFMHGMCIRCGTQEDEADGSAVALRQEICPPLESSHMQLHDLTMAWLVELVITTNQASGFWRRYIHSGLKLSASEAERVRWASDLGHFKRVSYLLGKW